MTTPDTSRLRDALDALHQRFAGPGGVAGVVHEGRIVAARAWGHADLTARRPMTAATRLPICSITKQFTCGVLLSRLGEPEGFDHRVRAFLPDFEGPLPRLRQLCDNQSGLRDYWALSILHGALAEQTFRREDALPLIGRMKSGHFAPGTGYSYSNGNFRILAEIIEAETGEDLAALYAEHIWRPAGMKTATLTADTRRPADDVTGYEGTPATGFFPAENGIFWIGDAGISAALDDMLAYECWIDATRDDPDALYARLSRPPVFADGTPARYGFGLGHDTVAGLPTTGHGGALRGFRAHRIHAAAARLSVVVMFNHEADARGAAREVMEAALDHAPAATAAPPPGWEGQWICPETGLLARILRDGDTLKLHYATGAQALTQVSGGGIGAPGVTLHREGEALRMRREGEHLETLMQPLPAVTAGDREAIAGVYESAELGARLTVEARDGALAAWCAGMLGQGRIEPVHPVGQDTWILATRRSMDAPAPGDWTLRARRDAGGRVDGLTVGCWLARGIDYRRVG
ncbi:D-aminopeptidase [Oceaniglobus roseus]|uniref:D-aminopeptidase n=1 Tax=Oceaniglobus roseus TaxID=1737570 RepID=UPI000C7F5A0E|nr:D-aminopeptidase [Kandeliimicrobium roseum]